MRLGAGSLALDRREVAYKPNSSFLAWAVKCPNFWRLLIQELAKRSAVRFLLKGSELRNAVYQRVFGCTSVTYRKDDGDSVQLSPYQTMCFDTVLRAAYFKTKAHMAQADLFLGSPLLGRAPIGTIRGIQSDVTLTGPVLQVFAKNAFCLADLPARRRAEADLRTCI